MRWLHNFLMRFLLYRGMIRRSKETTLPGLDGVPIYYVGTFFIKEMISENIVTKSSSLAFSFLLAIFPATIFLFTLIPYIPIHDFQDQLLLLMKQLLPQNAYKAMSTTLEDIIKRQHGDLLSLGFVFALYFSTNGINSLMRAFNKSSLQAEKRSGLKKRLVAVGLTGMLSVLILVGIAATVTGEYVIDTLREFDFIKDKWLYYLLLFIRWIIIFGVFFAAISLLYYYGPSTPKKFRFISAGSVLATVLFILTSVGFSFYVNNFGSYNKLYGSIGTLIVVMLWLYFSSMILLIGFELNASIALSKKDLPQIKPGPRVNYLKNILSGNDQKTL